MTNLTLTALKAVCDQKRITVPEFKAGMLLADKKKALQKLIDNYQKPAQKGASFPGEN